MLFFNDLLCHVIGPWQASQVEVFAQIIVLKKKKKKKIYFLMLIVSILIIAISEQKQAHAVH